MKASNICKATFLIKWILSSLHPFDNMAKVYWVKTG